MNNIKTLPLVSVIIPCYNAAKFIELALRSIMGQSYRNLEIICIDDCSNDSTLKILYELAKADDRIKVYANAENIKLIKTLNKAIGLSNGEYIARMDADDISGTFRIEMQLDAFDRDTSLISILPSTLSYSGKVLLSNPYFACTTTKSCHFMSFIATPIVHPSVLVKSIVLKKYLYSDRLNIMHIEDADLWMRMFQDNIQIKILKDRKLFFFRNNKHSITHTYSQIQFKNYLTFLQSAILNQLSVVASEIPLSILMGLKENVSKKSLIEAFDLFSELKYHFLQRNDISNFEFQEILNWYNQRFLYVCANSLIKSEINVKLYIIKKLYENKNIFFELLTWKNIIFRLYWNLIGKFM